MPLLSSYRVPHMRKFNFRLIFRLTGMLLLVMAGAMLVPLLVSLVSRDGAQFDILLSLVSVLAFGLLFRNLLGRGASYELHEKESFWITCMVWIVIPLAGALPFWMTGVVDDFSSAAFESFSGFTTTGSSLLVNIDSAPRGLLVWRSMTQWIGGLGLILFVIALIKRLDAGSGQLYDAEFSGTIQRKLHPHISKSVSLMWRIYGVMTLSLLVLLLLCGNGFVDSFCLALSTVSTGGFMPFSDGLTTHCSTLTLCVLAFFMFMAGANLALLYNLFTGRFRAVGRDQEMHTYLIVFVVAVMLSVVSFVVAGNPLNSSISYSLFHVVSTLSTCGFSMQAPVHWPMFVSVLTFTLLLVGASSGSTGGGIKIKRLMLMVLYVRNYFTRMLHPNAVLTVKIDGQVVADDYVSKVFAFVFLYICFIIGGGFVLTLCGLNIPDALCMAAANMSNLGPSPLLQSLGGTCNYAMLPVLGKWTLMLLMLAGRIEIFALLAILSPAYWKRR